VISQSIRGALSLALAAGLFVAGCSALPSSRSASGAESRATAAPGPPSGRAATATAAAQEAGASRTVYVRAIYGGTVSAGNFSVVIPPGALKADGIVTVRQGDLSQPVVDVSITPEDRNDFLKPVQLVADAAPMDRALLANASLSWWDPDSSKWTPCPGSHVNVADATVQAPLRHFSRYRVESAGRSGW